MSEDIYNNVIRAESLGMELMVDIYELADSVIDHDFRTETDFNINTHQQLQYPGECVWNRSSRAATVCLGLLCVLLLGAVIVMCVQLNANIHQSHIKSKNYTEERDKLLTKNTNLTEERVQLLIWYANLTDVLTKERDGLLTKYDNLAIQYEQLQQRKNEQWNHEMDGWIYYQLSFYYLSSELKSWNESRRYCTERGADLVIINNREEQDFVRKISKGESVWIGLSDSDEEGTWKWVDSIKLTSGFWSAGEPNDHKGNEDCVITGSWLFSSGWADYPCNNAFKWACEKSILK
ncbi:CD209 antigen-like isoform X1 [Myxocyprinus asiaticus]|uniref:CD209 antigen-like isoform X1 n=1 Tax=Myxocyprinus asiaticus TaxID=70543 RepID=UPI0022222A10|nr:CD209 antigen-like isoform X1 [Myxocyprinus asiaticus]